jgi:hypothetical protein
MESLRRKTSLLPFVGSLGSTVIPIVLVVLASKHRELVAQHDGLEVLGATGTYSEAGQGGDEDDR